ncbi:hypothetical protein DXG01_010722 [Tephrocybe rancida]|nr:hypothetical protein DXG01_010722 [Tephrocybe rancida]
MYNGDQAIATIAATYEGMLSAMRDGHSKETGLLYKQLLAKDVQLGNAFEELHRWVHEAKNRQEVKDMLTAANLQCQVNQEELLKLTEQMKESGYTETELRDTIAHQSHQIDATKKNEAELREIIARQSQEIDVATKNETELREIIAGQSQEIDVAMKNETEMRVTITQQRHEIHAADKCEKLLRRKLDKRATKLKELQQEADKGCDVSTLFPPSSGDS